MAAKKDAPTVPAWPPEYRRRAHETPAQTEKRAAKFEEKRKLLANMIDIDETE